MNTKRLFTAVLPPVAAATHLDDFLSDSGIRQMTSDAAWVKPHRWHITTCFMPAVDHWETQALEDELTERCATLRSFPLTLRGAGAFFSEGRRGAPIWMGVDGNTDALSTLVRTSRDAAARVGIRHESGKKFTPHLTVARKGERIDAPLWLDRLNRYSGEPFQVTELVLIESIASSKDKPPRYDVVARCPLRP